MIHELIGPTVCVVCWHEGHLDGPCQAAEEAPDSLGAAWTMCGCTEYVTKEQRGRIVVTLASEPQEKP